MRVLLVLIALAAGTPAAAQSQPSPETEMIGGLRVLAEAGDPAPGDSLAFVLTFEPVRGADGDYGPSPMYGMDCDRRLDRWDGAAWARVPDEGWRPEALVRQEHRPDVAVVVCRDAGVTWRPGVSGSQRFAYRLGGEAPPGWYRWCLTVSVPGEPGTRWLCSAPVEVAARVPAGPAAVPDSLIGRWEVVRIVEADRPTEESGIVAFRFSAGGVLTVERTSEAVREAPGMPKRFRYRVEGRVLVIEDGGEASRQAFAFEDGGLVIRDPGQGIVATFRRAAAPLMWPVASGGLLLLKSAHVMSGFAGRVESKLLRFHTRPPRRSDAPTSLCRFPSCSPARVRARRGLPRRARSDNPAGAGAAAQQHHHQRGDGQPGQRPRGHRRRP